MAEVKSNAEYLTEREAARERLRASVDALTEQASLQVQMQREPLKMLGGASAVGALIGVVVGRQFRRSKKIYVDAASPVKHQKALMKAQSRQQSSQKSLGSALLATVGTLAVKTLTERVITPKLEALSNSLLDRAGTQAGNQTSPVRSAGVSTPTSPSLRPVMSEPSTPATGGGAVQPASPASSPVKPSPASQVTAASTSRVEAKAQGSVIAAEELGNPNRR